MSPEQATGYAIDARSDIYSLGITAFHFAGGAQAVRSQGQGGRDADAGEGAAPRPDRAGAVRRGIARIVGRMCAKKPAERYQSCDELIADLDALPRSLGGRAGEAVGTPAIEKTRSLGDPVKPAQTSAPRPRPPRMAVRPPLKALRPGVDRDRGRRGGRGAGPGRTRRSLRAQPRAGRGAFRRRGGCRAPALRKVQGMGGYGNCVFFARELERGAEDAAAVRADFSAADPIHGRCYFPRAVGENRTGQIWEELWIDGRKRAHLIFDPPLRPTTISSPSSSAGAMPRGYASCRSGKHTLDVWIYRQAGDGDTPVPLAGGELVVRK